jgi:hypothetical protein
MSHISPILWQFLVKWMTNSPLFPPEASKLASEMDALLFFEILVSLVGLTIVFLLVTSFCILYRKERHPVAVQIEGSTILEATWTIIPLGLFLLMFVWGSLIYFRVYTPPANAMNIYVVGKQWMWKAEHPGGQHEINSLHIPTGRAIQLTLAGRVSQLLDSCFPCEARGNSGTLHVGVVRTDYAWNLSSVLHAILRYESFGDDRRYRGADAGRLQEVAGRIYQRHVAGAKR